MAILKKKIDIEKERLRIIFDDKENKYITYYGNTLIPYDMLNYRSKKLITKKNKELIANPQLLQKELQTAKAKQRFKKLESLGYTCGSFEYLGEVAGTMSKELEETLRTLTTEENTLLGIHRLKSSTTQSIIEDILINGLKMTGHQDGGITNTNILKNNISYYTDNKTIIKELMYANSFKNSIGSILIRIPDEELSKNIYIKDKEGNIRLNPKYIIGYVPLEKNHHIEKIITSSQIKNQLKNNYTYQFNQTIAPYYQEENEKKIKR